jgi:hypothetical protein
MWGIFFKLLSILHNTIMDLNNIINWFNINLILPLEANLPRVIVALVGTYTLPRGQHISTVQALNKFMTLYKSIESLAAAMKAVASLHRQLAYIVRIKELDYMRILPLLHLSEPSDSHGH